MKLAYAVLAALLCAGCTSSPSVVAQDVRVYQELEVECVASNVKASGCTTTHDIAIVAPLGSDRRLPSAADFRTPGAGKSEF